MHIARLDQPIDLAQCVMAPASGAEAVTGFRELVFEDRFYHEPDRLLDDAVLDRGHGRIKLHFDPDSLWDRLKSHTRFIRSVVRRLLS